jgi:NAD(P)-dependent dehydrogenase (short-subunit alcohol dehydrogenase family)
MQINNKIAIVTGGASGMGAATVKHLAGLGAKVVSFDINVLENTNNIIYLKCDVTNEQSLMTARQQAIDHFGIPQILINCAGIAPAKRMVGKEGAMPLAEFKRVIDINLIGTFNVMRLLTESMLTISNISSTDERGVIINTASIAAFEGQLGQMAYSASKGGIVAMTLPAARELAQHKIRVNTIAPGLIATPMLYGMSDEVQQKLIATTVFPKRLGEPSEFARLVAHIIENNYINGEVIRLDGAVRLQ